MKTDNTETLNLSDVSDAVAEFIDPMYSATDTAVMMLKLATNDAQSALCSCCSH
jgi:hypothetical protein